MPVHISQILSKLDEVRKDQRKFICLNDNMDHSTDESRTAQMLLRDFYESLFPIPSQFELAPNYRNRFLYTSELKEWYVESLALSLPSSFAPSYLLFSLLRLATRWRLQLLLYVLLAVLFFLCFGSLFYGKVRQSFGGKIWHKTREIIHNYYELIIINRWCN